MDSARRNFLIAVGRAAVLLAAGPASVRHLLAQEPASGRLLVHSARPEDFETPRQLLTSWLTPNELFYVRSHFYTPAIQESAWRLQVDGDVDHPLSLSLSELKQMQGCHAGVRGERTRVLPAARRRRPVAARGSWNRALDRRTASRRVTSSSHQGGRKPCLVRRR
jgi:hypothetical protein